MGPTIAAIASLSTRLSLRLTPTFASYFHPSRAFGMSAWRKSASVAPADYPQLAPATCLTETFSRFQTLIEAIDSTSDASCASS